MEKLITILLIFFAIFSYSQTDTIPETWPVPHTVGGRLNDTVTGITLENEATNGMTGIRYISETDTAWDIFDNDSLFIGLGATAVEIPNLSLPLIPTVTGNDNEVGIISGGNIIGDSDLSYVSDTLKVKDLKVSDTLYASQFRPTGAGTFKFVSTSGNTFFKIRNLPGQDGFLIFEDDGADEWFFLRNDTDNSLRIQEAGVANRMVFLEGGNVGIGTTTPSFKLEIDGVMASANDAIDNLGGNVNYFDSAYIDHGIFNTDVGIGTDDPLVKLHVLTGISTGITNNSNAIMVLDSKAGNIIQFLSDANESSSSVGIGWGDSNTAMQGRLVYKHSTNTMSLFANNSEKITILSSGNVGIGTTTPGEALEVNGNVEGDTAFFDVFTNHSDMVLSESSFDVTVNGDSLKANTITATGGTSTEWNTAYDDKINSASFVPETGVITLTQQDAGTVTVDASNLNLNTTSQSIWSNTTNTYANQEDGGLRNIVLGQNAGNLISTGDDNIFMGVNSGAANTTELNNVFIGAASGQLTTGTENVFIGSSAGRYTKTTCNNNVAVGFQAGTGGNGNQPTTGDNNTSIGYKAGELMEGSASGNVFLGYLAGSQLTTASNKLYIENSNSATPLIYGDFAADSVRIHGTLSTENPKFYGGCSDSASVVALTQNVEAQITNAGADLITSFRAEHGMVYQNDSVQVPLAGWYTLNFGCSYSAGNNAVIHTFFYVDNVHIDNRGHSDRGMTTAKAGAVPGFMDYYFSGGEWVKLGIENTGDGTDATIIDINWSIKYDE